MPSWLTRTGAIFGVMHGKALLVSACCGAAALAFTAGGSEASRTAPGDARLSSFVAADQPAWSRDGRQIAFVAAKVAGYEAPRALYVMNTDGSSVRQLTEEAPNAAWPSWSPDGRSIAFTYFPSAQAPDSAGIYVVSVEGSGLRRIVPGASDPAWGPGGKRIAFSEDLRIRTVLPDGKAKRLVADPGPQTGGEGSCKSDGFFQPTWSPDGEFVAFSVSAGEGGECGFDVYIGVNRGFGAKTQVLAGGWFTEPDWPPRGGAIALARFSPSTGLPVDVGIFDLRTRRVRYLRKGWHPRWSPDARRLVFVHRTYGRKGPRSQIYVMNADGSNLQQLTG